MDQVHIKVIKRNLIMLTIDQDHNWNVNNNKLFLMNFLYSRYSKVITETHRFLVCVQPFPFIVKYD